MLDQMLSCATVVPGAHASAVVSVVCLQDLHGQWACQIIHHEENPMWLMLSTPNLTIFDVVSPVQMLSLHVRPTSAECVVDVEVRLPGLSSVRDDCADVDPPNEKEGSRRLTDPLFHYNSERHGMWRPLWPTPGGRPHAPDLPAAIRYGCGMCLL